MTKEELELMREWVRINPDIHPLSKEGQQELVGLFKKMPLRIIYTSWYSIRKVLGGDIPRLRAKRKPANGSTKTELNTFYRRIADEIEKFVEQKDKEISQLRSTVTELKAENAKMKEMLRKLKDVRAAVQAFKL